MIPDFENEDDLENITERMIQRGFREEDIIKVLGGNFLRLLKRVLTPKNAIDALGLPMATR